MKWQVLCFLSEFQILVLLQPLELEGNSNLGTQNYFIISVGFSTSKNHSQQFVLSLISHLLFTLSGASSYN